MVTEYNVSTQAEVAEWFSVTTDTIKRWRSRGMPGKSGSYPLSLITIWARENIWNRKRTPKSCDPDSSDALMGGPDSPALEKYREEQFRLARLKRLEIEQTLLPRDRFHSFLMELASVVRGIGEWLQRSYGNEASERLNETIDGLDSRIEQYFGDYDINDYYEPEVSEQPGG